MKFLHIVILCEILDETLTIPPFSMLETMARVNGKVQGQTWLLQECRAKQLPVKIANGPVSSTCDQVPIRLLNPSPDSRVVYKGTKIATVEGVDDELVTPSSCSGCATRGERSIMHKAASTKQDGGEVCE